MLGREVVANAVDSKGLVMAANGIYNLLGILDLLLINCFLIVSDAVSLNP